MLHKALWLGLLLTLLSVTLVFIFFHRSDREGTLASLKNGESLALQGRNTIPACVSCHGQAGEGNDALGYPRLAGLNAVYLAKQLADFARDPLDVGVKMESISRDYSKTPRIYKDLTIYSPGIREHAGMHNIAKALSADEKRDVAAYYAGLPFIATPKAIDFQTLERGRDLALRGKPEFQVPRCEACHGPNGEGFGEHFPPLAGQPIQYLLNQINQWQRGARDNDHLSMMKNVANMLTDGDKLNVAAYYSNRSYRVNVE